MGLRGRPVFHIALERTMLGIFNALNGYFILEICVRPLVHILNQTIFLECLTLTILAANYMCICGGNHFLPVSPLIVTFKEKTVIMLKT